MEKASDGSFARITRKTAEDDDDDEDEKDWGMALNRYLQDPEKFPKMKFLTMTAKHVAGNQFPSNKATSRLPVFHDFASRTLRNGKNSNSRAQQAESPDIMRGRQTVKSEQPRDNHGG